MANIDMMSRVSLAVINLSCLIFGLTTMIFLSIITGTYGFNPFPSIFIPILVYLVMLGMSMKDAPDKSAPLDILFENITRKSFFIMGSMLIITGSIALVCYSPHLIKDIPIPLDLYQQVLFPSALEFLCMGYTFAIGVKFILLGKKSFAI